MHAYGLSTICTNALTHVRAFTWERTEIRERGKKQEQQRHDVHFPLLCFHSYRRRRHLSCFIFLTKVSCLLKSLFTACYSISSCRNSVEFHDFSRSIKWLCVFLICMAHIFHFSCHSVCALDMCLFHSTKFTRSFVLLTHFIHHNERKQMNSKQIILACAKCHRIIHAFTLSVCVTLTPIWALSVRQLINAVLCDFDDIRKKYAHYALPDIRYLIATDKKNAHTCT